MTLKIRIPGWARDEVVPSELYRYTGEANLTTRVLIGGNAVDYSLEEGYAVLNRKWSKGDQIELQIPMPVRKVLTNERVESNRAKLALERGPVVYCAEGIDNEGRALNLLLEEDSQFQAEHVSNLLNGVSAIRGSARVREPAEQDYKKWKTQPFTAIPYYAWAHRGTSEMTVWFPYRAEAFGQKGN